MRSATLLLVATLALVGTANAGDPYADTVELFKNSGQCEDGGPVPQGHGGLHDRERRRNV